MRLAKSWKQPMVSLAQARKKVIWILLNENIVSILQDTVKKSEQIWEPWATYMHVSLVRYLIMSFWFWRIFYSLWLRTTFHWSVLFLILLFVFSSIVRLPTPAFDILVSHISSTLILGYSSLGMYSSSRCMRRWDTDPYINCRYFYCFEIGIVGITGVVKSQGFSP